MSRLHALLLFACLSCLALAGQKPHFQFSHLDIRRGLSNNQFTCFFKDQKGFLWVGTMSGLNRYDGYHFRIFRNSLRDTTSISGDYIAGIRECPGGKMWIQTRSGITIYDPASEKFDRNVAAFLRTVGIPSSSNITQIEKDKEGNFLFLSDNQILYKYTASTGKAAILVNSTQTGHTIATFCVDNNNQYWLIQHNGFLRKIDTRTGKGLTQTSIPANVFAKETVYNQVFVDRDNELWISGSASTNGLLRFNPATSTFIHYQKNSGYPRSPTW